MLYRFKSQAAADVIMLEVNAHQILKIIGKPLVSPGILSVAQMPAAIAALRFAMEQAQAQAQPARTTAATQTQHQTTDKEREAVAESISLRQRAAPFLVLLERSAANNKDVVWGV